MRARTKIIGAVEIIAMNLLFVCIGTSGVLAYYYFDSRPKHPRPDLNQSCPLEIHGRTVYLTPAEKSVINCLLFIGVASGVFAMGWALCFWSRLSAFVEEIKHKKGADNGAETPKRGHH